MIDVAVIGAGKIGRTIAAMLTAGGDMRVTLVDQSEAGLAQVRPHPALSTVQLDIGDTDALRALLAGHFAVLSAAPFHLTARIAEAAVEAGVHYLDLTEDVASTRRVKALADSARTALIPQCGLAPGFVSVVAADLASQFKSLDAVRLRVGALPQYPSNALGYNLTWSTDGIINEYCEPCEAIADGKLVQVPALEELEELSLDGTRYEAFNTSGGLGTLCDSFAGQVRTLNYRTIRYPGHCALMRVLLRDLRLAERRPLLKDILEHALPTTMQDVVVVLVSVTGLVGGKLVQKTYANHIHGAAIGGAAYSAIQVTTAAGICAVLDMLATGQLPGRGLVRQEQIGLDAFLANRFGRAYAPTESTRKAA